MNLLKLTIASGSDKGNSFYVHTDKICCFTSIVCRAGVDGLGEEKGSNIRLDNGFDYMVEENVKDICEMLESRNGYLKITSMPKKD